MIKHMPVCVKCHWPSIFLALQTTSVLVYPRFIAWIWQSCSTFACRSSERSKNVIYQGRLLTLSSNRILHDISSLVDTRDPASIIFSHSILLGSLLVTCRFLWGHCCALAQGKRECQIVDHQNPGIFHSIPFKPGPRAVGQLISTWLILLSRTARFSYGSPLLLDYAALALGPYFVDTRWRPCPSIV